MARTVWELAVKPELKGSFANANGSEDVADLVQNGRRYRQLVALAASRPVEAAGWPDLDRTEPEGCPRRRTRPAGLRLSVN